ncbi:MAG TPA: aminotransferase class V-fold PLP-dependent enzyme [Vitreimonas sp.]|uniref:pyridoxal phosphate-dependent decarboxylase family protein n=1 Tax=Vitreimonas sp. TaxID=3069702 RepID=UPI002D729CE8|nr:aminotransferase class V-fold PLP-dependent enzyme [Vitreimonas sp.]HYD89450.1 aminotransferase class V-fold PLP-dependent enzyme [Vitreimonas sp.]
MTDQDWRAVLADVVEHAVSYREGAPRRRHNPQQSYAEARAAFDAPTPERAQDGASIVAELARLAEPGLANIIGPRFFGWVMGQSHPTGVAADWLVSAWGQNVGNAHATPTASACEEVVARWLLDLLDLPPESSVGFVSGATMANFTCLAAARGEALRRVGWDVEADGLVGAPPIHVVVGEEAHSTIFSALRYLGLGAKRIVSVPVDQQGRMRAGALAQAIAPLNGPMIVIAQAGHINSGGFDPFSHVAEAAHAKGAWVHVDGAFGLWARACKDRAHLGQGLELCDSWGVDGHKWLQTPYDSAYAIVRDASAHRRAMGISASYLPEGEERHPADFTPELSRRARGFATWATIKAFGREGIDDLVQRDCALARRMAERLGVAPDVEILNDVVLNQVALRLGSDLEGEASDALTVRTIARIQREGVCFVGGAHWRGRQIIRISVCGMNTTEADADASADAILDAWRAERAAGAERIDISGALPRSP